MEPEDLDKIFNERLGKASPTPSPDLWSRLQERIEEELPAKEEKKPIMIWARTYAVAAAITVLLSAGVVFYNVQQEVIVPEEVVAQVERAQPAEEVTKPTASDKWVNMRDVEVTGEQTAVPSSKEQIASVEKINNEVAPEVMPVQKSVKEQVKKQPSPERSFKFNNSLASTSGSTQNKPQAELRTETVQEPTVSFASATSINMNAAPVEIIIKRSADANETEALASMESASDFSQKKSLVKKIFKQVKKLSNGEPVNLDAIGLNADRIALETQIGKQKISKVINL